MKRIVLIALTLALALVSCSLFTPRATPTPEATATTAATQTATHTASPTAAPTHTPTATPEPTPTETPLPTPTPEGFYLNNDLGFSMSQMGDWYIEGEEATYVVFTNDSLTTMAWLDVGVRAGDLTIDEFAELTASQMAGALDTTNYTLGEPKTITITEKELDAQEYILTFGGDMSYLGSRIVIVDVEGRYYSYLFLGPANIFTLMEDELYDFLDTFAFFQPRPYGLAPETTLYRLGSDPSEDDIDPALMTGSAAGYPGLLFAGLVALKPDLSIAPDLALEWQVTEGGTVYTFTLRDDIRFASGDPITAQDVKDSWERAADPDIDSSTVMTYLGDILGVPEKHSGDSDEISGVVVIDERTLEVTLDGPKPYFLAKLSYPTSFVVDVAQIEENEDWWQDPNASGPFQILNYEENDVLIFERNPNFYGDVEVPHIVYNLSPGGTQISLFETGELDIAYIGGEDVLRMQDANEPLGEYMHSTTTICTDMIKFDNTLPPFDDINVRKAFTLAIDQNAVNEQFSEGLDRVAIGVLPPAMPGYTDENAVAPFDVTAAQDALAESDYAGDMPEIIISAWGYGDTDSPYVSMLVDMWQNNLDVEITVEYIEPDRFSEIAREEHGQMVVYGWCADYPDPENFLRVLFHTDSDFNVSGYTNPDFDVLVEQAAVEQDPAERISLYQEAETLLLEDFALLPMSHNVSYVLVSDKIRNFTFSPTSNIYARWLEFGAGD
jgi:ABC-type transport system substrate-binding protein